MATLCLFPNDLIRDETTMKSTVIVWILLTLAVGGVRGLRAQTDPDGNYEVYSRETSQSAVGYLTATFTLTTSSGVYDVRPYGAWFVRTYTLATPGVLVFGTHNEIRFALDGAFRIGGGFGQATFSDPAPPPFEDVHERFYMATLDAFAMELAPQYTYVFDEGNAITLRVGVALLTLGATAVAPGSGVPKDGLLVYVPIIPMAFRVSALFDLGRSGLGVEIYSSPSMILGYRYVPPLLRATMEGGIVWWDSSISRTGINLTFIY